MVAESAVFGTAIVADLLRETDPEVLLATQAVNAAARQLLDDRDQQLARLIINELAKAWK